MNKLRKIFTSFFAFFTSMISKVLAVSPEEMARVEIKYGVFEEPSMGEKILRIVKNAFPLVLFIIGLSVVFRKKVSKKVKIIIISILLIIGILVIANNY